MSWVVGLSNNSYKPITNTAWVRARLCKLQKRVHCLKLDPFEIGYKRTTAWIETKHDRNRPYAVLIACPSCMYLSAP
jgi:hypothetical protein